jgi:hypothetical protein
MLLTTNGTVTRICDAFEGKPLFTLSGYQNNKVSSMIFKSFRCTPIVGSFCDAYTVQYIRAASFFVNNAASVPVGIGIQYT